MNYKGTFSADVTYDLGDVVVFEDDKLAYIMIRTGSSTPHDVRCWERLAQPFQEIVLMFHAMFTAINTETAKIPDNISDEAVTLSTETADYLITVDDSGDTPELTVTKIEEEGAGT
ncbi:MAG: hypothetical protein J6Y48_05930 [Clostridia bacterium]|nr:hypothetical protein [Clostridia bacterium]